MLNVKTKRTDKNAVIPFYATPGSAGMDVVATSVEYNEDMDCYIYGTGLHFELPEGYVMLVFSRSSVRKHNAILSNCVGVLDSDYRGELMFSYKPLTATWASNAISDLDDRLTDLVGCTQDVASALSGLAGDIAAQLVSIDGYAYDTGVELDTPAPDCYKNEAPYKVGDKIGQIIILPYPKIQFNETFGELSNTERGEGGHGSTGDRNQPKVSDVVVPKNDDELIIK